MSSVVSERVTSITNVYIDYEIQTYFNFGQ